MLNLSILDRARDVIVIVVHLEATLTIKEIMMTKHPHAMTRGIILAGGDGGIAGMNPGVVTVEVLMRRNGVLAETAAAVRVVLMDQVDEKTYLPPLTIPPDPSIPTPDSTTVLPNLLQSTVAPRGMSLVEICDRSLPVQDLAITLLSRLRHLVTQKQSSRLCLRVMTQCLDHQ